jgi:hypothetical protein
MKEDLLADTVPSRGMGRKEGLIVKLTKRGESTDKKPVDYQARLKKIMAMAQLGFDKERELISIYQLMVQFMANIETHFGGMPVKDEAMYESGKEKMREGMELIWQSLECRKEK